MKRSWSSLRPKGCALRWRSARHSPVRCASPISQSASSSNAPASSASCTKPISTARFASTGSPVVIISMAASMPTARGSRWVPPQPGIRPTFTSGRPIFTFGEFAATR
jgi:hypothetical protein